MDYCDINSSWEINGSKQIKDAIKYFEATDVDSRESTDEFVSIDTCLQFLTTQADSNDCIIKISCKQEYFFSVNSLTVLSEARNMEVYGHQDEYLHTVKGDLVEKVDDMAVYCKKIEFEKPCNIFTLKFVSLNHKYSMWLYGIKICLSQQSTNSELPQSSVDLTKVKEMLLETQRPLSESAEKFLHLVEQQQEQAPILNLMQLFQRLSCNDKFPSNNLNGSCNIPTMTSFCNGQKELNKFPDFSHLIQAVVAHQKIHPTRLKEIPADNKAPDFFNLLSSLVSVMSKPDFSLNKTGRIDQDELHKSLADTFDQKLQVMEDRIMKHISEVEERLQTKLDRLIALLDKNQ